VEKEKEEKEGKAKREPGSSGRKGLTSHPFAWEKPKGCAGI